jgi:hypothetical protein
MSTAAAIRLREIAVLTRRERRVIQAYRGEAVSMDGERGKLAALAETVRALDDARVPYALIGGVAVAFDPSFDPIIARAERFEIEGPSVAIVRKADLIG